MCALSRVALSFKCSSHVLVRHIFVCVYWSRCVIVWYPMKSSRVYMPSSAHRYNIQPLIPANNIVHFAHYEDGDFTKITHSSITPPKRTHITLKFIHNQCVKIEFVISEIGYSLWDRPHYSNQEVSPNTIRDSLCLMMFASSS